MVPYLVLLDHLYEELMHFCMLHFSSRFHWFVDEEQAQTLPYSSLSSANQSNHQLICHRKTKQNLWPTMLFIQYLLQILLIISQTKVYISIYSTKLNSSPIIRSVQRTISSLWTTVADNKTLKNCCKQCSFGSVKVQFLPCSSLSSVKST